jgi:hypothetical protein
MNPSVVKTRTVSSSWEKVRQMPDDGAGGDRRRGGVSRTQAFAWNCRNQALDAKGEAQAAPTVRREYRCKRLGRTDPYER